MVSTTRLRKSDIFTAHNSLTIQNLTANTLTTLGYQMTYGGGTFYLMTGMDPLNPPFPLWNAVTTWYSCNPQGPWSNKTKVYTAPEAGANGCKAGTLVTYNAKAHPEFTDSDGILLTYNVNANTSSDLVCANDYMPRFLRLTIPGVTAAAKF